MSEEKMKAEKIARIKLDREENIKRLEAKLQRLKEEISE